MKVFVLILFLNTQTGDIDFSRAVGVADNSHQCQQMAALALSEKKIEIPEGTYPFIICNDLTGLDTRKGPGETPPQRPRQTVPPQFDTPKTDI